MKWFYVVVMGNGMLSLSVWSTKLLKALIFISWKSKIGL